MSIIDISHCGEVDSGNTRMLLPGQIPEKNEFQLVIHKLSKSFSQRAGDVILESGCLQVSQREVELESRMNSIFDNIDQDSPTAKRDFSLAYFYIKVRMKLYCMGLKEFDKKNKIIHEIEGWFANDENIRLLEQIEDLDYSNDILKLKGNLQLPDELKFLKNLKRLSLKGLGLYIVPAVVYENLIKLEHLDLSDNFLNSLHSNFSKLQNLKHLDISQNRFTRLPAALSELRKLEAFIARGGLIKYRKNSADNLVGEYYFLTSIENVPKSKKLQVLNLSNNHITDIVPLLRYFNSLKELNVSHNHISELPFRITWFGELEKLNLSDNRVTCFPYDEIYDFGSLKKLTYLDISSNDFRALPSCIGGLKRLKYLNICSGRKEVDGRVLQNLFLARFKDGSEGVPSELFKLKDSLETLIFDNNNFEYDWFKKIRLYPTCFNYFTCLRDDVLGGAKSRDYRILTNILRLRDAPLKGCQKVSRWFKKNFGCCCGVMMPNHVLGMELNWMERE